MDTETGGVSGSLPPEQKRAALDAVLQSETFPHAGQLRTMLTYVCEREIAGQGSELSEYTIGVDVLRRPEGYSSTTDSSVRKRVYELRQKLQQVYATELSGASVRIDIPKGSYVPHFTIVNAPAKYEPVPGEPPVGVPAVVPPRAHLAGFPRRGWIAALLTIGTLAGFAAAWSLRPPLSGGRPDPLLAEAWGPMGRPGADVLLCIATNLHLLVRPYAEAQGGRAYPAFPELYEAFRKHRPLPPETSLSMLVADNSVTFGEVWAAALASATLRGFGASHQILPESAVPFPALRNRNVVVVGVPMDSQVISDLLSATPYTIEYAESARDQAILDRRTQGVPKVAFSALNGPTYGLLTVLKSEGSTGGQKQTVVFSGIGSAPAQAAAEFFCSPARLAEFKRRLRQEGHSRLPSSYQVVVRCNTSQGLLVSYEYAAHVVIAP